MDQRPAGARGPRHTVLQVTGNNAPCFCNSVFDCWEREVLGFPPSFIPESPLPLLAGYHWIILFSLQSPSFQETWIQDYGMKMCLFSAPPDRCLTGWQPCSQLQFVPFSLLEGVPAIDLHSCLLKMKELLSSRWVSPGAGDFSKWHGFSHGGCTAVVSFVLLNTKPSDLCSSLLYSQQADNHLHIWKKENFWQEPGPTPWLGWNWLPQKLPNAPGL